MLSKIIHATRNGRSSFNHWKQENLATGVGPAAIYAPTSKVSLSLNHVQEAAGEMQKIQASIQRLTFVAWTGGNGYKGTIETIMAN